MKVLVFAESSWVCRRLADLLLNIPGVEVYYNTKSWSQPKYDLTYFVPYLEYEHCGRVPRPIVALMTHSLPGKHGERYNRIARAVDHCVTLSSKYYQQVGQLVGYNRVSLIFPPVHQLCSPRPLRVLWPHRHPPGYDNRKRYEWVSRLRQYKWVEVLESGGNLTPFELYAMMRKSDVVLITSTHEAGPLSVMEGLASGVPVMIGRGVGLQQDFAAHPGVIAYEPNDFDDLVLQLRGLYIRRENYALSVAQWNENYWVEEHKKLFERVYNGQYQTSNA